MLHSPNSIASITTTRLYNHLQLPSVAQCVLDDGAARAQHIPLISKQILLLLGEVDPSVLDDPASARCEIDDCTLGLQEEEVLCVRYGDRGVCLLRTGSDLFADGSNEEL